MSSVCGRPRQRHPVTEGSDRSPVVDEPTEHPVDSGRPGLVHVSELLAAHGRSAAPAGGRRRRAAELAREPEVREPEVLEPQTSQPQTPEPQTSEPQTPVEDAMVEDAMVEDAVVEDAPVVQEAPVVEPERGVEPAPEPAADPAAEVTSAPDGQPRAGGLGEWVVVVGQLVGALVVGAALWFGFRYLWDTVAVLAAVLATLLTIGLVVGVRGLRRDNDVLSSALAVVAGLVVAFSPPVLALTGG